MHCSKLGIYICIIRLKGLHMTIGDGKILNIVEMQYSYSTGMLNDNSNNKVYIFKCNFDGIVYVYIFVLFSHV